MNKYAISFFYAFIVLINNAWAACEVPSDLNDYEYYNGNYSLQNQSVSYSPGIYVDGDVIIGNNSFFNNITFTGNIYATGNITVNNWDYVTGSIFSQNNATSWFIFFWEGVTGEVCSNVSPISFCPAPPDVSDYTIHEGNFNLANNARYPSTGSENLYVTGNVELGNGSEFHGDIYAVGSVTVRNKGIVYGSVYSEGSVSLLGSQSEVKDGYCDNASPISPPESSNPPIDLPVAELIDQCNDIFPDAAQGFSQTSELFMHTGPQILGSNNNELPFVEANGYNNGNPASDSCGNAACSASGNNSVALSYFMIPSIEGQDIDAMPWGDGENILLGADVDDIANGQYKGTVFGDLEINQGTITFAEQVDPIGSQYQINSIKLVNNSASLNFYPGVYAVNTFESSSGGPINIIGEGDVYLFIENVPSGMKLEINGDPEKFHLILNEAPPNLYSDTVINGAVYVNGNFTLDGNVVINGQVAAENLLMRGSTLISNTNTCGPPSGGDTYSFHFDGTNANGITCEPHQVNIQVRLGDTQTSSDPLDQNYSQTINLSTEPEVGDWSIGSANGSLSNQGGGKASYTFSPSDNGQISLLLDNKQAGDVSITVQNSDAAASYDLNFDTSIIKSEFSCTKTISGNCINIANRPFDLTLTAVKENEETKLCENYNPDSVLFWSQYVDPSNPIGLAVEINSTAISSDEQNPSALAVTFTGGIAIVQANYPDAGKITVNVEDADNQDINGNASTIVNPFELWIANVEGNVRNNSSTVLSSTNNPASEEGGDGFIRASVPDYGSLQVDTFDITINAQIDCVTETAVASNCSANQAENIAQSFVNDITLDPSLIFPTNASAALGTVHSEDGLTQEMALSERGSLNFSNLGYDEVGTLGMLATSIDYLVGDNDISESSIAKIGRFYPSHLALNSGSFFSSPVCSGNDFAYIGEPDALAINYQLSAYAQTNLSQPLKITTNYDESFNYPVADDFSQYAYTQSDLELKDEADINRIFSSVNAYDESLWKRGQYNIDLINPMLFNIGLQRALDSTDLPIPDGPFDLDNSNQVSYRIQLSGNDGEKLQLSVLDTCLNERCEMGLLDDLMYGRLQAGNGHGSEFQTIRTSLQTTYFDGNQFSPMYRDQCTVVAMDQISSEPSKNTNDEIVVGSGKTKLSIVNESFINGLSYFDFYAPSSQGELDYYIDLHSESPWLLDSSNEVECTGETAGLKDCVSAHVQFGLYRGNERIIYRLQTFN